MSQTTPPSTPVPGSPGPNPAALRYPTRTKVIVALVLAVAIGGFVVAYLTTASDPDPGFAVSGSAGDQVRNDNGVQALVPGDGDEVLGQQRFGVDLAPGWTGELRLLPSNGQAMVLPVDELTVVEELDQIFYQPQPGKTIERLDGGTNCVAAVIWDRVQGREASERTVTWCFSVV